jgi:hypothetical protein
VGSDGTGGMPVRAAVHPLVVGGPVWEAASWTWRSDASASGAAVMKAVADGLAGVPSAGRAAGIAVS